MQITETSKSPKNIKDTNDITSQSRSVFVCMYVFICVTGVCMCLCALMGAYSWVSVCMCAHEHAFACGYMSAHAHMCDCVLIHEYICVCAVHVSAYIKLCERTYFSVAHVIITTTDHKEKLFSPPNKR